ncbi:MAG: glycosyltransferase, partial [Alphaproteobacteria bacterium]|nr:glycosyltransferase [Alphaproteobacteria bacterium]
RGVDTETFHPRPAAEIPVDLRDLPRPWLVYVGRVSVEKNIAAFLDSPNDGSKIVVGDGPQRERLMRDYPDAHFVGPKFGEELARYYAAADVFVFPSLTDTFGLVLLEALASGTPVAAFPVPGPLDVVGDSPAGCLDADLSTAIAQALTIDRALCRQHALEFSWDRCADLFESYLEPIKA